MLRTNLTSHAIDEVLAASFPASDPPAWTPGVARLAPATATREDDSEGMLNRPGGLDLSRPPRSLPTFAQALVSLLGAMGIALAFPVVMLAVGIPIALAVRGLVSAAQWLIAMIH